MCGLSLTTASLSISAAVWEPWAAVPGHSCCVEWWPAGLQVWSSPGGLLSLAFSHLWRGFPPKVRTLPLCRAFQNQSLGLEGTLEVTQLDHHSVFTSLHHPSQRSCSINLALSREVCSLCISFLSLPLRQKAKQSIPVLSLAGCGDCVVLNEGVDH